jgi:hypothetical protein
MYRPAGGNSSPDCHRPRFTQATADTVAVPAGCTVFPKEIPRPSRRWAARRYTDIRYWSEPDRGGHFAAVEQPDLFVTEAGVFCSLDELTTALENWIKTWNATAWPFKWTKTADQIIDRICRYCSCLSGPAH